MSSIFITGSGRRIGRGLALEFASRGWDVAVHFNRSAAQAEKTASEIRAKGQKAVLVKADVTDYEEVSDAFDKAAVELGIPGVLVNNAGVFPVKASLLQMEPEDWDHTIDTNLRGEFYCAKKFAEIAQPGARIINFASLGAFEIWKERIAYNVSKAGVIQLTKALARDLAPDISVNAVSPGAIYMPDDESPNDDFLVDTMRIPMGRYGSVADIFEAVYFFATTTQYITGQNLIVDGGYQLNR